MEEERNSWPATLAILQEKTYELMAALDGAEDGHAEKGEVIKKYLEDIVRVQDSRDKLRLPEAEAARSWTWFNVER